MRPLQIALIRVRVDRESEFPGRIRWLVFTTLLYLPAVSLKRLLSAARWLKCNWIFSCVDWANAGWFGVGGDMIVDVAPYRITIMCGLPKRTEIMHCYNCPSARWMRHG